MIIMRRHKSEEDVKHYLHKSKKLAKFAEDLVELFEDCLEEVEHEDDDEEQEVGYRKATRTRMRRGY